MRLERLGSRKPGIEFFIERQAMETSTAVLRKGCKVMIFNEINPSQEFAGKVLIRHAFGGGGGSKAVLATAGMLVAAKACGITEWDTMGAISGSIPVFYMVAAGRDPSEALAEVIRVPFESKIKSLVSKPRLLYADMMRPCAWRRRETSGVLSAEELGKYITSISAEWPDKIYTVVTAVDKSGEHAPLVVARHGVWQMMPDGTYLKVAEEPPPPGLVVEAAVAVPGMIRAKKVRIARKTAADGITVKEELLLDGALNQFGRTPIAIAKHLLGAKPGSILACDVGADPPHTGWKGWVYPLVQRLLCGSCCDPLPEEKIDSEGVVLVQPRFDKIKALEFEYSLDQKWEAVTHSITGTVLQMAASGQFSEKQLSKAKSVLKAFEELLSRPLKEGELAYFASQILKEHGLY